MVKQQVLQHRVSRRTLLRAAAGSSLLATSASAATATAARAATGRAQRVPPPADDLLAQLDAKIEAAMARHHVPGVAGGVRYQGQEYGRGYGVTNVDSPQPVDGDPLFRIASTTKTFTGTVIMRLVEQGRLDLDATVRTYLPDFRVADELASERVTLRQCLNHSAGWLGNDQEDFGRGD